MLCLRLSFSDAGAQWVQANGPYGGNIHCLTVSGPNLFAGVSGGVYLSTNNGTSWSALNAGMTNDSVLSFAIIGTNLFAGTSGGGVFLSTDNGTSWNAVNNGLTNLNIMSFAVSGSNLFAGTNGGGVFLSTNNGVNWTTVSRSITMKFSRVNALVVSDTNLFAGTSAGVFLSGNNGASWTPINTGLPSTNLTDVTALAVSGTNLFAGTQDSGIYLSTNNGTSWTAVNAGLPSYIVSSLEVSPNGAGGTNLFAAISPDLDNFNPGGGVFLSTNNGTSWSAVNSGLTNNVVQAFALSGMNLFAGTEDGVFLSTNNGASWTSVNAGLTGSEVLSIAVSPTGAGGTNLFASTFSSVFLSTDSGTSWTSVNSGLTSYVVNSLAFNGTDLFAGTHVGVYLSTNNETSWNIVFPLIGVEFVAVSPNGTGGTNLLAAADYGEGGLCLSTDNGADWVSRLYPMQTFSSFAVSPTGTGGSNLFVGGNDVFLSTNYGISWTKADSGLPNFQVLSMAVNSEGTDLYAGTDGGGVYLSTNDGTSWVAVNSGLTNTHVYALAVSGTNLFAGTGDGVFLSTNNGTSWSPVNTDLTCNYVYSLAINGPNLLAGTAYGGVWSRPLSQMSTGVKGSRGDFPAGFSLSQNYPNPFNPSTMINYQLPTDGHVTLVVSDVLGREVRTLVNEVKNAGSYEVKFDASSLASGIYFYRVNITGKNGKNFVSTKKMLLMK